jgi:Flp pilus assembly protein TadD
LEGRSEYEEGRFPSAEAAFSRAADAEYEIPSLGFLVATELTRLKYPRLGLTILARLEKLNRDEFAFWDAYFDAAFAARDAAAVLKSAERCFQLRPNDDALHNRYAAALMLNRSNPDEAIKLTLQLYGRFPNSSVALINHACALLLNQRAPEARGLLEQLDPAKLDPLQSSAYYLALFEAYHDLQLWDLAAKANAKILVQTLFPSQRQWLEEKLKDLPPRLARNI